MFGERHSFEWVILLFYDNFERECKKIGKKPREIAKEVGIKTSTLSMWKTKGVTPKYGTIKKIADALGVEWSTLVSEEQKEQLVVERLQEIEEDIKKRLKSLDENFKDIKKKEDEFFSRTDACGIPRKDATILLAVMQLNNEGKKEAIKRVEELTWIPKYTKKVKPQAEAQGSDPRSDPDTE